MVLPDRYGSPELLRINPKRHWPENLEAPSGVQELRCWTSGVLNIMHHYRNEIALDAKIEMVHDSIKSPCRSLAHLMGRAYMISEVGGLSSTGKSFRVVRACARCVCLVSSG